MDGQIIKNVIKGLTEFKPVIVLAPGNDPMEAYKKALSVEPALVYFISTYSMLRASDRSEIRIEYRNTEFNLSDIKKISSEKGCRELLAQTVEEYKKDLLLYAKNTVNVDKVTDSFWSKDSVFYPNLKTYQRSRLCCNDLYTLYIYKFKYRIGRVKLEQMEIDVDKEVDRLCKLLFREGMPDEAKIYLIHNYMATSIEYLKKRDNRLEESYTQSAYGALIKKHCVCQGFAEAFKRIMDREGIDCIVIRGIIKESGGAHAWNLVSPGKNCGYYHIDTTWDVSKKRPEYDHFCKNDTHFDGKREWDRKFYPQSTGTYPILAIARRYVKQYRDQLLEKGIDKKILDV